MKRVLSCENYRKFDVEIELNKINGIINSLLKKNKVIFDPEKIAFLIRNTLNKSVEIQNWSYNYNNDYWIVKPNSSYKIEVLTPILKGYTGLIDLIKVIESFREAEIKANDRCSLRVNINISDLSTDQLASVIAWYIKCEHIFIDSVPYIRKNNYFCRSFKFKKITNKNSEIDPEKIIKAASSLKYYSLNTYNFIKRGGFNSNNVRKKTIEFRLGKGEMCTDGLAVKNWIRLLIHFVEMTKDLPLPYKHRDGDNWSGLSCLNFKEFFNIMKFDKPCSDGLEQMKSWFFRRIFENSCCSKRTVLFPVNEKENKKIFLNCASKYLINNKYFSDSIDLRKNLLFGKNYSI
jgi:hypothetical protein